MKRSFAYLLVAAISLALCGCGNMTGNGNVAASPAPAIETPLIPSPDLNLDITPLPDESNQDRHNNSGSTDKGTGNTASNGTDTGREGSAASPKPSSTAK